MRDEYRVWIFDCDGVLLDSNQVKTRAFHALALPYGEEVARALVDLHRRTGGVSRFVKVRQLHEELLEGPVDEAKVQADIVRYGELCREGLARCAVLPGVRAFLDRIEGPRYVVSGGLQEEVEEALTRHGLRFDGIFGSPRKKDAIFAELQERGLLREAVYFGDSRYDHEVAERFGVDFVFVDGVSEFHDADAYFASRPIRARIRDFRELLECPPG